MLSVWETSYLGLFFFSLKKKARITQSPIGFGKNLGHHVLGVSSLPSLQRAHTCVSCEVCDCPVLELAGKWSCKISRTSVRSLLFVSMDWPPKDLLLMD